MKKQYAFYAYDEKVRVLIDKENPLVILDSVKLHQDGAEMELLQDL